MIQPNLARMSEYIRFGTLDFLLTKPISSQFMVSFRHVGIYNWLDPILGFGLVAVALVRRGEPVLGCQPGRLCGSGVDRDRGHVRSGAGGAMPGRIWAIGAEGSTI